MRKISSIRDCGHRVGGLLIGPEPQVFLDGELGKHLAALGDAGDAGGDHLVGGKPGDVGAVEQDAAGARRRQPQDRADQRGLAGAVRAKEAGDAAGLDGERHVFEHIGAVIGRDQALDLEPAAHCAAPR